jgi:anti-sigma factor RsiW
MTSDDIELLAYVDGALSTQERESVERKLAASPDAALRVARLEASRLPYAQAFAHQRLPPVPPSLTRMVDGIAQAAHLDAHDAESGGSALRAARKPRRHAVASGWLAAAFFAGALVCALSLHVVYDDARSASQTAAAPWVDAAAHYQQLYSRETLATIEADRAASKKIVSAIHQDDDISLAIPDLSQYGLTFKRIQRLRFEGRALVQIVYLPERGNPVALCIMRETQPDAAPSRRDIASMDVVTWRRGELGYALIGAPGSAKLDTLARHIADGDAPSLLGSLEHPLTLASIEPAE